MPETFSTQSNFHIGDYFEIIEGPWTGTKGQITRFGDSGTFSYIDCKTGKELLLLDYVLKEKYTKKRKGC